MNVLTFFIVAVIFAFQLIEKGYLRIGNFIQKKDEKSTEVIPVWASRLTQYVNHDTTAKLDGLQKSIDTLCTKFDDHVRQHDRTNYILEAIQRDGITCRNKQ